MNKKLVTFLIIFFAAHAVFAQTANWSAVMTKGTYKQAYNDFATTDEATEYIKKKYTEKQTLADLVYADGRWYVVTSEKTGNMGKQTWLFDTKIPNDWIAKKWDEGYEIAKVTYGDGKWFVYMRDDMNARVKTQTWATRTSITDMRTFIREKWKLDNKYTIEDICFGNGTWFVILSKEYTVREQTYTVEESFPTTWIQEQYNKYYNVSSAEFDGVNWFIVTTKLGGGQAAEKIYPPVSIYPKEKIKTDWDGGKRITSLIFNNKTKTTSATEYSTLGYTALNEKNYYKAIEYFDQAVALGKADANIYNNRAWAKFLTSQCEGALSDIDESLKLGEADFSLHSKGAILNCLGRYREALTYLDKAMDKHKLTYNIGDVEYYSYRAEAKKNVGDYEGAKKDILAAIKVDPDNRYHKTFLSDIENNIAVNAKPVISWDFPVENEYVSTTSVVELSGCIKSKASLSGKWVSINGDLKTAQTKDLTVEENCNMYIKTPVTLKPGKNEVYFYVETNGGLKGSSVKKTIYYNPVVTNNSNYALLIANETYNDPAINPLADPSDPSFGPYADIKKLKNVLTSKYGYAENNIVVLKNANKAEIVQKLQYFKFISPNSTFMLMYSGHGDTLGRTGFWLPQDAKLKQRETYLSNGELMDYLNNINAKHILLLADACFSGSIILSGSKAADAVECTIAEESRSFQALTSGANTRVANSSLFMNNIVQILNGSSSCITSEKLYFLLKQNFLTQNFTSQTPQYGLLKIDRVQEGGHFTFFKN